MRRLTIKHFIIKYIPIIMGVIGVLLSISDLLIDKYTPDHFDGIVTIFTAVFNIAGCTLFGVSLKKYVRSLSTDNLTGLYTRSYLYSQFTEEMNKMSKNKKPLSMLMIDIDKFKLINDNYGHMAGDSILKQLSNLLRNSLKNNQTVIRWGGEEFLIMLPNMDNTSANDIAENIRTNVSKKKFYYENTSIFFTVSIGIVTTEQVVGIEELVKSADQLLYQAKKMRNVIISESFFCNGSDEAVHYTDAKETFDIQDELACQFTCHK